MLALERRNGILSRVRDQGSARVADLARELGVTQETVRRDLEWLRAEGKLIRTHGGALRIDDIVAPDPEVPSLARALGAAAARRINPDDIVAIDCSPASLALARAFPEVRATVITNSVRAIMALGNRRQIKVVVAGGELDAQSNTIVGPLAEEIVARLGVQTFFYSPPRADISPAALAMRRHLFSAAKVAVLMVESEILRTSDADIVAPLPGVDFIITDSGLLREEREQLQSLGIAFDIVPRA